MKFNVVGKKAQISVSPKKIELYKRPLTKDGLKKYTAVGYGFYNRKGIIVTKVILNGVATKLAGKGAIMKETEYKPYKKSIRRTKQEKLDRRMSMTEERDKRAYMKMNDPEAYKLYMKEKRALGAGKRGGKGSRKPKSKPSMLESFYAA